MSNDTRNRPTFAVVGLGFISDRHLQAIDDVGGHVTMACDIDKEKKHKADPAKFFTNWKKMFDDPLFEDVDYVSICTPNHLHFEMATTFAGHDKKVICEKPLVLNDVQLGGLPDNVYSIVQLRYNKEIQDLKQRVLDEQDAQHEAEFKVHIHRDSWYFDSWKADKKKSGGLMFNIGVHYFDLLCHIFGTPKAGKTVKIDDYTMCGLVNFPNCKAKWSLTIKAPMDNQERYLKVDGKSINLTRGFERLHRDAYEAILAGEGFTAEDVAPALTLVEELTNGLR